VSYYQKYRPQKISELDLVSVRQSLLSHLSSGVTHSYLFVGPRGTGKTSAARILASVVNCEKNKDKKRLEESCGECNACKGIANGSAVDILEIDAASNGSVEDIRDLRDKVRLSPVSLTKKVYIIDEVHMVSLSGFNALLKTLEEPPERVMFVLCTTEAHKVPQTIMSRCMQINFVRGQKSEIMASLSKVVTGEKLDVGNEALEMIARMSDGSFREAHKLLEQVVKSGKKIDSGLVEEVLGFGQGFVTKLLIDAVVAGDKDQVVELFRDAESKALRSEVFFENLLFELRTRVESDDNNHFFSVYSKMIRNLLAIADQVKFGQMPFLSMEMVLLEVCMIQDGGGGIGREDKIVSSSVSGGEKSAKSASRSVKKMLSETQAEIKLEDAGVTSDRQVSQMDLTQIKGQWFDFIARVSKINQGLAGLLRSSTPVSVDGGKLVLEVFYQFHKDQIEVDAKRQLLVAEMEKLWGVVGINCVLGEREGPVDHGSDQVVANSSVEDIFGV
jgi:DNA polymerase III subunit gamma/tau